MNRKIGQNIEVQPLKLGINDKAEIDFRIWRKVKEAKQNFFEKGEDPRRSPYIPVEVAESWIRSKNYGIDPYQGDQRYKLPQNELDLLARKKEMLIQTAVPLMKKYLSLLSASGYRMLLTDENGVALFIAGDPEIDPEEEFGMVLNEKIVGTNAHALCIILRKPVQFIGPYNYCVHLDENIVSATPIFDENRDLIGTLTIYQLLLDKEIYNMQTHSLGWITSMAYAIENQLKLKKANDDLTLSNGTLDATLSVVDGGLITLNRKGIISHINTEGSRIFGVEPEKAIGDHFAQYIKDTESIFRILEGGKAIKNHEISIVKGKTEKRYIMSVYPIYGKSNGKLSGVVLHLSKIENIKKLVNDWRGAQATYSFKDIKGQSPLLLKSIETAKQYAQISANVLIQGESGTGKELFAQSIHNAYCPEGPFIAINCSAMPRNLIESELFGYEGGAFTGAERKGRPGLIELANGGTLFLDEIGDMPLELQPILLRVLEDKKVMRVGGKKYIPVNFRVISASNKDLSIMVREKTFREDLYYRLSVFKLLIPPLRDRKEDIVILANYFIKNTSQKIGSEIPQLCEDTQKRILEYDWPGNIRQLENAMVFAVTLAKEGLIKLNNLPDDVIASVCHDDSCKSETDVSIMSLKELEINAIKDAMKKMDNNIAKAAQVLGLGKSTLYKKLKYYNISH